MIEQNLGESLRRLREERGMSLRSLAAKTGFSPSFISQIENSQASPSISSMEKIAAVLEITLWQFFQAAQERRAVVIHSADRSRLNLEWSRAHIESLGILAGGEELQAVLVTLEPGGLSGKHEHPSIHNEFAFVQEGEVALGLNGEEHTLRQGDSVVIPAGETRRWNNTTTQVVKILIVSSAHRPPESR
jgi:quercetin dioxygenase-like cupin family protein